MTTVNSDPDVTTNNESDEKLTAVNSPFGSKNKGAFGAITKSIDQLNQQAMAAKDIEARLREGSVIVELDPALIESSFISDRIGHDKEAFAELIAAIRDHGQNTPILVRPHPEKTGRYQVVYGHRRLRAAVELGRPVKAVVKELSDQEHILAQGQENSARANLSFIEKALFTKELDERGYGRDLIISALSVDKTVVSKMLSVVNDIPYDLIIDIGPAKNSGRDKWYKLAKALRDKTFCMDVQLHSTTDEFQELTSSDERLENLFAFLNTKSKKASETAIVAEPRKWTSPDKSVAYEMKRKDTQVDLKFKSEDAGEFGDWLSEKLDQLHAEFKDTKSGE
ncbi:plasmid partitioning protein RepB [Brucella thiophenivorans]|uniref:Plasmid partitioning protein RepB n=1 Tax=Brucella thiophenivorans TaxID=571255 RepID=A0A256FU13_9HYPH|nr:plasmid partitioning protein RepB [Brucella thiophenivorans]